MKRILLSLLVLMLSASAFAQYNFTELDDALKQNQKLLGTDIVAMIWKGDSLIYKKEMGEFNSKTQAPIASCSKWLTAAVVMQFVDEGKLSLDDKIVTWLPEYKKYFKNYITIRDCLSHMTGIEDEGSFLKRILQRRKYQTLEEEVNAFASREIRANPGTDFWYGNVGLNIAGRVLEIISRKRFDVLIKTKLLAPLAMRKTSFSNLEGGALNPSGGAVSTADDYMKFLVMLMHKGKYNGVQILSENAVNEMMKIRDKPEQIQNSPKSAEGYLYASGAWVMESKDGVATTLTCPGLFGTWPMIDFCRGYAYIVFVKDLLGEERANVHRSLKAIIDAQIPGNCPAQ